MWEFGGHFLRTLCKTVVFIALAFMVIAASPIILVAMGLAVLVMLIQAGIDAAVKWWRGAATSDE